MWIRKTLAWKVCQVHRVRNQSLWRAFGHGYNGGGYYFIPPIPHRNVSEISQHFSSSLFAKARFVKTCKKKQELACTSGSVEHSVLVIVIDCKERKE